MFSMPPATRHSASPARIACAARATVLRPLPHTLLMVVDGTLSARPAPIADWRAVFCPRPGLEHVAHEHLVDGIDARAAQRLLDGDRSESGRGHFGEHAAEGADRRPHGADDDRFFHANHSTPGAFGRQA